MTAAPQEVADDVFRLGDRYVNFYLLVEEDRVTIVDAGLPKDWSALTDGLAALELGLEDVDALVLTHAHEDHIGFAEQARNEIPVSVRVHSDDEQRARGEVPPPSQAGLVPYLWRPAAIAFLINGARRGGMSIPHIAEVETYEAGSPLDVPGRPVPVLTPGHTAGHCALHLPDRRVLIAGDAIVTRNVLTGRTGPQLAPDIFNDDTDLALRSLGRLAGLEADVLLPGHGEPWRGSPAEAVAATRVHA